MFTKDFQSITRSATRFTIHMNGPADFRPFPHHLIHNEQEKHMLMAAGYDRLAVGMFYDVLQRMLKSSSTKCCCVAPTAG